MLLCQIAHLVEVDAVVALAHAVAHGVEPLAREVGGCPVGQVAARGERQAEHGVAGLRQRHEHREVGRRAAVRLDVGEAAAEQLLGALDREALGDVDVFATAVVAPPGIALGVLVGQHRALGGEHRRAHDVLGRDQLDLVLLARELLAERRRKLGVIALERALEEAARRGIDPAGGLGRRHQAAASGKRSDIGRASGASGADPFI